MAQKTDSFSKWIVKFLVIQGVLMMWASYFLAWLGRVQIAETLSKTVCIEIVGVAFAYYGKAGVENLSKNNTWPDRPKCEETGGESA